MALNILVKKLQEIGFDASEARVYLATLEAGNAPASVISKNARMNRVSAYSILRRLMKTGMVSVNEQGGVLHFQALSPDILVEDAQQKAKNLAQSLPLLQSLSGSHIQRPTVQFFEGIVGVKKAYLETLSSQTEILNYANSKNIRDHWREYDDEYVQKRAEKKIYLRGLAPDDSFGKRVHGKDSEFYREIRLLSVKHFQVENEIHIFDDKFLIVSFEPVCFAILMQSKAVADTQRQIFEIAWEAAAK